MSAEKASATAAEKTRTMVTGFETIRSDEAIMQGSPWKPKI
jgi:hypothetical protein